MLTDIGNEELNHVEMIGAILYQLTKNLTPEEIKAGGMDKYFVDHTLGVYPASADGVPFDTKYIASKGDILADLHEDLAADAAILKEQSLRKKSRNSLKYKDESLAPQNFSDLEPKAFSHLGKTLKKRHPAII